MAIFRYQALDADQQLQKGQLDANDRAHCAEQLQKKGWLILDIRQQSALQVTARKPRSVLTPAALINVTQQLATLTAAGQPLERALLTLINQTRQPKPRALLMQLHQQIKSGKAFSVAIQESGQFSTLYCSMVHAGEASGALHKTLAQLADYLERAHVLRGQVVNALIYPAFLVFGVVGALTLLLTFVVPQFVPIFRDMGVPIPLITQVILWLGQQLNHYGLYLLLLTLLIGVVSANALRNKNTRRVFDRRLLTLPLFGPLLQRIEAAKISRTLGTLLANGVSMLQALRIVENIGTNSAVTLQLQDAGEKVKGGQTLAASLGEECLLPSLLVQMIEVGENAGKLDAMLLKVSDIFDTEAKRGIDRLMAILVPALTVVMALMVAVIMLAIMMPLMSLTSNI